MDKNKFSLKRYKAEFLGLVRKTDQETLAIWAIDCAERVISYFEIKYPEDKRPRTALETLREWINTGEFKMSVIRKASLDAHAAARNARENSPARSAARSCGQAVATAHVPTHSIGAAIYALQAIYREANASDANSAVKKELEWQHQHLQKLKQKY